MNVIPQIFYDLIARIVPAIAVLIGLVITFYKPDQLVNGNVVCINGVTINLDFSKINSFWGGLFIVVCLYILGIVLKMPCGWLSSRSIFRRLFFVKKGTIDKAKIISETEMLINQSNDSTTIVRLQNSETMNVWSMLSWVRILSANEGYRLLKMAAEIRLCELLSSSLIVFSLFNIILLFSIWEYAIYRVLLTTFLLFSARSILSLKYHLEENLEKSVLSAWLILNYEKYRNGLETPKIN